MNYFLVFVFMAILDFVWTRYLLYVEERKSIRAGICSILIYLFGTYSTLKFIEDRSYIIPAVIGAFIGTFITVEYEKRK